MRVYLTFPFILGLLLLARNLATPCFSREPKARVAASTFLFHMDNIYIYIYIIFLSLLTSFDKRIMHVYGDIMGLGSWESF